MKCLWSTQNKIQESSSSPSPKEAHALGINIQGFACLISVSCLVLSALRACFLNFYRNNFKKQKQKKKIVEEIIWNICSIRHVFLKGKIIIKIAFFSSTIGGGTALCLPLLHEIGQQWGLKSASYSIVLVINLLYKQGDCKWSNNEGDKRYDYHWG